MFFVWGVIWSLPRAHCRSTVWWWIWQCDVWGRDSSQRRCLKPSWDMPFVDLPCSHTSFVYRVILLLPHTHYSNWVAYPCIPDTGNKEKVWPRLEAVNLEDEPSLGLARRRSHALASPLEGRGAARLRGDLNCAVITPVMEHLCH